MRESEETITLVKNAMLAVQRYPWEQGVCMQALYELGDITTAVAMAHDAVLRQTPDGRLAVINDNIAVTDPAANGEMVYRAYEITGNLRYKEAAEKMLSYLMTQAPRTEKGILCHNEISFHEGFSPNQIWVDSIYMAPPFLAVMGELEEAVRQIEGMYAYLYDKESGLLRHIYDATQNRFVRDKLWATGNGWALLGMVRVLENIQKKINCISDQTIHEEGSRRAQLSELKNRVKDMFLPLLDNMIACQLPDGRFHDVLNDSQTFVDGAAAMMMAAAIYRGCVNGFLSEKYLQYANLVYGTMDQYVDDFGLIHEVCGCPDFLTEGTSAESMAAYLMMHAWHDHLKKD